MLTTTADGLLDDRGRVFGPHERGRMTVPLVTPGAGGFRVNATISARFRAVIVGGRPERGRSCRPATPCSANRRRSRLTCTTVYPRSLGDLDAGEALSHQQHRSGAPTEPRGGRGRSRHPLQLTPIRLADDDGANPIGH